MPPISDDTYKRALVMLCRTMTRDEASECLHRAVVIVLERGTTANAYYLARAASWQHAMARRRATRQPRIMQRLGFAALAPQLVEDSSAPATQLQDAAVSQALARVPQAQLRWLRDYVVAPPEVPGQLRRRRASRAVSALRELAS